MEFKQTLPYVLRSHPSCNHFYMRGPVLPRTYSHITLYPRMSTQENPLEHYSMKRCLIYLVMVLWVVKWVYHNHIGLCPTMLSTTISAMTIYDHFKYFQGNNMFYVTESQKNSFFFTILSNHFFQPSLRKSVINA